LPGGRSISSGRRSGAEEASEQRPKSCHS
jgi:hypothetical protein